VRLGREVHDDVDTLLAEDAFKQRQVADVPLDKCHLLL
jgi:hypothetical protein